MVLLLRISPCNQQYSSRMCMDMDTPLLLNHTCNWHSGRCLLKKNRYVTNVEASFFYLVSYPDTRNPFHSILSCPHLELLTHKNILSRELDDCFLGATRPTKLFDIHTWGDYRATDFKNGKKKKFKIFSSFKIDLCLRDI